MTPEGPRSFVCESQLVGPTDERTGDEAAAVDPDRSLGWIRRLLPLLRPQRGRFAVALVASGLAVLAQLAIPVVIRDAIEAALPTATDPVPTAGLAPYVGALIAFGVARAVLGFVSRDGLARVAFGLEASLRGQLYEHLTRLSFSFYDRVQTGQLVSRANSDVRSVQMYLTYAPSLAVTVVSFALALVLMLQVHVGLTLLAVAALPGVFLLGLRMRQDLYPLSWVVQARLADVATIVDENVTGTRVVKSFAGERRQVALLERAARRLRWATVRQFDTRARYGPLMEQLPRVGLALVLLYGGSLAIDGRVSIADLVMFNFYVVMLQAPFRSLGFLLMLGQRAAASARRIYEVLDTQPEIVDRPGAITLTRPGGEVELAGVDFAYPGTDRPVLRGLSLHLEPGDTVALVGRTGAGKSSVARLLTRFYDVDAGAVRLDGHDVRDLTLASVRDAVGVVIDEPFLFSDTIFANIAFGRPDASLDDVVRAATAAGADDFIAALPHGYDTVVGERGYTLSGGQRQRVAIARTLLVDPPVLVLDDATSAVDAQREEEIHAALRTLMANRTTLVIAQRLSTIALADRVALLDGGRVVAEGTHAHLLATEPRYTDVLDSSLTGDDRRPVPASAGWQP
ncbi:MAG: ABC transporter ATP-binding protein/permease [Actinomycetota bacterium]|nr:ABC transporter ATP-binding protein/permease [Actinomycetota bacterium]